MRIIQDAERRRVQRIAILNDFELSVCFLAFKIHAMKPGVVVGFEAGGAGWQHFGGPGPVRSSRSAVGPR